VCVCAREKEYVCVHTYVDLVEVRRICDAHAHARQTIRGDCLVTVGGRGEGAGKKREEGKEGGREEGGREEGRKGGREEGRKGGRNGGRKGRWEDGRKSGREEMMEGGNEGGR